eukprot:9449365-Karenia_brevis.AAC.1
MRWQERGGGGGHTQNTHRHTFTQAAQGTRATQNTGCTNTQHGHTARKHMRVPSVYLGSLNPAISTS